MLYHKRLWALVVMFGVIATGCTMMGNKLPEPTVSHLRISPAYVFAGSEERVKLQAMAFDARNVPVSMAIGARISMAGYQASAVGPGAATIHPDGTFEATQPGYYEITFTAADGHATKKVPVTVVDKDESTVAHAVMAFTRAVETNDLPTVHQYIGDSFVLYDDYFGTGAPETIDDFDAIVPRIVSWSIGGITVDPSAGAGTLVVSGTGELEVMHLGPDGKPFHTSIMAVTSFEVVPASPHPKIVSVRFEPLPPDPVNGANMKLIISAPAGPTIRVGEYAQLWIGYVNEGGNGYYYMYTTTTYNGHTHTGRITARDGESPVWVGAKEREGRMSGSGTTYTVPGELVIQIEVVSGPSPTNLQRTDYKELRYTVVP